MGDSSVCSQGPSHWPCLIIFSNYLLTCCFSSLDCGLEGRALALFVVFSLASSTVPGALQALERLAGLEVLAWRGESRENMMLCS